jgi:hypothetical protein
MLTETVKLPDKQLLEQRLDLEGGRVHDAGDLLMKEQTLVVFLTIKLFSERLLLECNRCRTNRQLSTS